MLKYQYVPTYKVFHASTAESIELKAFSWFYKTYINFDLPAASGKTEKSSAPQTALNALLDIVFESSITSRNTLMKQN